nr:hypothetical protein [Persicitalea jodogahamensis]
MQEYSELRIAKPFRFLVLRPYRVPIRLVARYGLSFDGSPGYYEEKQV